MVFRERAAKSYRVSAYFLAKQIADQPLRIASLLIYSAIIYFFVSRPPLLLHASDRIWQLRHQCCGVSAGLWWSGLACSGSICKVLSLMLLHSSTFMQEA